MAGRNYPIIQNTPSQNPDDPDYRPPKWFGPLCDVLSSPEWNGSYRGACEAIGISAGTLSYHRKDPRFQKKLREVLDRTWRDLLPAVARDAARRALQANDNQAHRYAAIVLESGGILRGQHDAPSVTINLQVQDRARLEAVVSELQASGDLPALPAPETPKSGP